MVFHSYKINISGRVQGVGFRPFVFNLAHEFGIRGYVTNSSDGVMIIAIGTDELADAFYRQIQIRKPDIAIITSSEKVVFHTDEKFDSFSIRPSESHSQVNTLLTPDFAICENCKSEIFDENNRRYFYPFTSCTQCGPRYSITERFPFERENTSMKELMMCEICNEEYIDPSNHRFHSQTNSCPSCGIKMKFTDAAGNIVALTNKEVFENIALKLSAGNIVAVKNTGGYLLLCDATNERAVALLRLRKNRPTKPFAVMFKDLELVESYLLLNESEISSLKSAEAPIVILKQKGKSDLATERISPRLNSIGAMLPNSGTMTLIAESFKKPMIATSGNSHGSPICSSEEEAVERLSGIADYFLHNSLRIRHAQDDSVMKFSHKHRSRILIRRSRGFAPNYIPKEQISSESHIYCAGSDLKNTICIHPNTKVYVSEYLGDLTDYNTGLRFESVVQDYYKIFDFHPEILLCDKHPGYLSTIYTQKLKSLNPDSELQQIQHHKAHFAALLAEQKLIECNQRVLGVIWDGIGYGKEREIWGGEFFVYEDLIIERVGHLEYYPWIQGDKMSKSPKLSALALSGGDNIFKNHFNENEWLIYTKAIQENSIKTSSMGRMFDAVAYVLGFEDVIGYEGEAAIYIEQLALKKLEKHDANMNDYLDGIELVSSQIPSRLLFARIINERIIGVSEEEIALNFHYTLVKAIEKIAFKLKIHILAFSGGVFQNALLVDLINDNLSKSFDLHFHQELSANDENISFGQLSYYQINKKQENEY